jgi:hypothetical protein
MQEKMVRLLASKMMAFPNAEHIDDYLIHTINVTEVRNSLQVLPPES